MDLLQYMDSTLDVNFNELKNKARFKYVSERKEEKCFYSDSNRKYLHGNNFCEHFCQLFTEHLLYSSVQLMPF